MASLKFAIVGTGRFGQHYIRLLKEIPNAVLVAAANKTQGNAESVLASRESDCVVIASPAFTHFNYIQKALASGKHVLVEKPMVLSVSDAEKVRELVQGSGKIFMVAHQYLYHRHVKYLEQQIKSGVLGKIRNITMEHLYPGPIREDVGVFWDAGPHEFAILDFLLGPVSVIKAHGEKKHTAGKPVEDYTAAEVELSDGTTVKLTLSSNADKKSRKRIFTGDKRTAIFEDSNNNNFLQVSAGGKDTVPQIAESEPLRNELEHFIDCVRSKKTPMTDVEHGLRVVKNLEAVYNQLN